MKRILKGQTLLGLMISLAISSWLLLLISAFYVSTQVQNREILLRLKLQAELQRTIQLIGKDIRRAGFRALNSGVIETNLPLFELDEQGTAIFLSQEEGAAPRSCVLFFYDLDGKGCIGKGTTKYCAKNNRNTAIETTSELFGYKLSQKMVKTKLTYQTAIPAHCKAEECRTALQQQACNPGGGWRSLLDEEEYEITKLQFDWLIEGKGMQIQLAGNLKAHPHIKYETALVIGLWNQK